MAMEGPATSLNGAPHIDQATAVACLLGGFSLEATRPSAQEVTELSSLVPRRTQVYVSAVPSRPAQEQIEAAIRLRAAGLEPVPHLAVRNFATAAQLADFLARMNGEAGVQRVLVIAGDREPPAGEFRSARDVIDGAILPRHGIRDIGLAGYPDGHPRISEQDLDLVLSEKIEAAEMTGLSVHIVTQFSFRPEAALAWLARLRAYGVDNPVRVGLVGPTGLTTLMRYAKRCGVAVSAQQLARHARLARQLFALWTPDSFVSALARAQNQDQEELGALKPHFFSFGGLLQTARWVEAVAAGRITLAGLS
jgi:methylenetetrahydrofolate reductase (NADPH)